MNTTVTRLILFVLVFLSIAFLPWWLTLIFVVMLSFYFPLYLEIILFGFIFDNLFLASYKFPYVTLILTAVILITIMVLRSHIRR